MSQVTHSLISQVELQVDSDASFSFSINSIWVESLLGDVSEEQRGVVGVVSHFNVEGIISLHKESKHVRFVKCTRKVYRLVVRIHIVYNKIKQFNSLSRVDIVDIMHIHVEVLVPVFDQVVIVEGTIIW